MTRTLRTTFIAANSARVIIFKRAPRLAPQYSGEVETRLGQSLTWTCSGCPSPVSLQKYPFKAPRTPIPRWPLTLPEMRHQSTCIVSPQQLGHSPTAPAYWIQLSRAWEAPSHMPPPASLTSLVRPTDGPPPPHCPTRRRPPQHDTPREGTLLQPAQPHPTQTSPNPPRQHVSRELGSLHSHSKLLDLN